MNGQAWIVLLIFVAAVLYSIVMASISPAFRTLWNLHEVLSYALYFVLIMAAGVLIVFSAECSIAGGKNSEGATNTMCVAYSWVIVALTVSVFALFLTRSILVHLDEKKQDKNPHRALTPTVVPLVLSEST